MPKLPQPLNDALAEVGKEHDADIFIFSGGINRPNALLLIEWMDSIKEPKPNVFLILTTRGGDPDAAFLIARTLKARYKKFIVAIYGLCKSAGTLIVVGANDISMSDSGELGPLDIQLGKDDELYKRSSGLDLTESISFLKDLSWEIFLSSFVKLKQGTSITTKTAAEIAQKLSMGIIDPIASQIDPIRLGEIQRSLRIASDYGRTLNPNMEQDKLAKIISGYPSHGYIIDRSQAKELFSGVREPSPSERKLKIALAHHVLEPTECIECLIPSYDNPAPESPVPDSDPAPAAVAPDESRPAEASQ